MASRPAQFPVRNISRDEWAAVPRSLPTVFLTVGTWLPLLALLAYFQFFAVERIELQHWADYLVSYSMFVGLAALIWCSGRSAALLGLLAAGGLWRFVQPAPKKQSK